MRSALILAAALGAASAVGVGLGVSPAGAEVLSLNRAEALALAQQAFIAGNPALANAIARHLVQDDPQDAAALLILSASTEAMGEPQDAFRYGRMAWAAAAPDDPLRYEIARQTAHAAVSAGRHFAAVAWLMRARDVAPSAQARARTDQDLAAVRAHSPLSFSANAVAGPTDNLNAGASTGLLTVDDVVIGGISGWSVAQPGWLANGGAGLTWDLGTAPDGKSRNTLGLNLSQSFHVLTPEAQAENPDLDASDLNMTTATLSFGHDYLQANGLAARWGLEAMQNWYGGAPYAPGVRLTWDASLPAPQGQSLTLSAVAEQQWQDSPSNQVRGGSLSLSGTAPTQAWGGSTLGWGGGVTVLASDWSNTSYSRFDVNVSLSPKAALGPFQLALSAGASLTDYPVYSLGFANVTDGRSDRSAFVALRLGLAKPWQVTDQLGLQPTLNLEHRATMSNISKYETQATSLSLGMQIRF